MLSELSSEIRYRLRALFRRRDVERELADELRFHLEREAEKLERAGLPRDEAARRARLAFGGVDRVTEETRDARGLALLDGTLQDLRYALRALGARRGFTAGIVLTLALGIGASAAMFGVVDRLLFRAPPFLRDAERVHRLYFAWSDGGERRVDRNMAYATYLDVRRWTDAFSTLAAFQTRMLPVGDAEQVRELPVTAASASYFDLFDARPALGRFFAAHEDRVPAGTPVVVLGHAFWRTHYGGRADILGAALRIGETPYTVIGVAPEGFVGVSDQGVPAAFIPITAFAWERRKRDYAASYDWSWLEIVARRRADARVAAATAQLTSAYRRSWVAEAAADGREPRLERYEPAALVGPVQYERGPQANAASRVARWVAGVTLVVLLVACANVANLLLSRAVSRRREIAMRLALGASRGRLVRQLLTESLALAALGGVAGLAVAQWGGSVLGARFLDEGVETPVVTDGRTLLFAAAATLLTALLTGLAPALHATRGDLVASLRGGAREGGQPRTRARTALVLLQASLSVVLLVGAGLFVRSLEAVRSLRLGYDVDPVLYAEANPRGERLDSAGAARLVERLLETARATPGVTHATLTLSVPFWSNEGRGLWVPGVDSVSSRGRFVLQGGSPDYFRTVGTRILRGRGFAETDRADAPLVVVVSEGMARAIWPGRDAIGQCIRIGADSAPCRSVVGIAEEARLRRLADEREFSYYIPIAQADMPAGPQLFARVRGDAAAHAEVLRRRLQGVLPGAAYATVVPLRTLVDPTFRSWRLGSTMFGLFGALALALAAIGLYGVVAYGVAERVQELAIRIALGAPVGDLVRLVVLASVRVVVAGIALGGAAAFVAGRWIEPLLFRQSARDPAIYAAVAALLLVTALAASLVPALRATRVDPNSVLRTE